jgi:hypothetical protein
MSSIETDAEVFYLIRPQRKKNSTIREKLPRQQTSGAPQNNQQTDGAYYCSSIKRQK